MPSENRPAPAVGQVWRHANGVEYVILQYCGMLFNRCFCADGIIGGGIPNLKDVVLSEDTYVGHFDGFKVKGME